MFNTESIINSIKIQFYPLIKHFPIFSPPDHPLDSGLSSNLPTPDLISCTRVNSQWENTARKHLLARTTVSLDIDTLKSYLATMHTRSQSHSRVKITLAKDPTKILRGVKHLSQFEEFATQNSSHVRHLSIDWWLNGGQSVSRKFFAILKNLKKLTSLELRPFIQLNGKQLEFSGGEIDGAIPSNFYFSKIKKLVIIGAKFGTSDETLLKKFIPKILPHFPNVGSISLKNVRLRARDSEWICETANFFNTLHFADGYSLEQFAKSVPPTEIKIRPSITRLGLNYYEISSHGVELVKRLAQNLEHLHLHGIKVARVGSIRRICLPNLAKLKLLKISINPYCKNAHGVTPGIGFISSPSGGKSSTVVGIDYKNQLPVIEKLAIVRDLECEEGKDEIMLNDGIFFDAVAQMMNEGIFVRKSISPCKTLRWLEIPGPIEGQKVKRNLSEECDCGDDFEGICDCEEGEDVAKFFDRVRKSFPMVQF